MIFCDFRVLSLTICIIVVAIALGPLNVAKFRKFSRENVSFNVTEGFSCFAFDEKKKLVCPYSEALDESILCEGLVRLEMMRGGFISPSNLNLEKTT